MVQNKFNYNPKTLDFEEKSSTKLKRFLISAISIFTGGILIFILILIAYSYYYEAKHLKSTSIEYNTLKEQYKELTERKKQNDEFLNELIEKDKKIFQAILKSEPDNSIFERKNPYTKFKDIKLTDIIEENKKRLNFLNAIIEYQNKEYGAILKLVQEIEPADLICIPAIQPVYNKNLKYPVYGFGQRIDQVYKSLIFHPGIDYAVPEGTVVFATADGVVETSGSKRGLGNRIVIDHGNGFKTTYAHLEDMYVFDRKKVKRGDKIGNVGMTGKTLISHLHYEIQFKSKPINPVNFFFLDLDPREYSEIRTQSSMSGLSLD
jgi:murein DD-endopeptidase MepM/ murein hydrolase activator NlpD